MLLLSGKARIRGNPVDACGVVKALKDAGLDGLEAAALGRGEVVGEREGGQVVERAADALEAPLELDGAGRDRWRRRLGAHAAERVAQELAAVGLVRDGKGLDQRQAFPRREPVALDAVEELGLLLWLELAQCARERRANFALAELLLRLGREVLADGQPVLDPSRLVAQEPPDLA